MGSAAMADGATAAGGAKAAGGTADGTDTPPNGMYAPRTYTPPSRTYTPNPNRGLKLKPPGRSSLDHLLERNAAWAHETARAHPELFPKNRESQQPEILWIGCSDSRIPETTILNLLPGDIFVHRNVGNIVSNGDMSIMSVIQFAVDVLKVQHVIVCGHYGCGGCSASLSNKSMGLIDNWLRFLRDVRAAHSDELEAIECDTERNDRFVELNVVSQVHSLSRVKYIARARSTRGLEVHGWVYDVATGLIVKLEIEEDEKASYYLAGHEGAYD